MFNTLTGFARPRRYRQVLVAPAHLREGVVEEIERTIAAHREGKQARIRMKMNALVDGECIRALYRASQAGVPVELNVRGICCLKPGVPGISDHITVVSVVGRFLEHSRVYAFERGEETEVYIGSADLMPRNLDTRVELLAPVLDPELRAEVVEAIELCLADNVNAWVLDAEGAWQRRRPEGAPLSGQRQLMARHTARAAETTTT
jgi:polyphosphate kinase